MPAGKICLLCKIFDGVVIIFIVVVVVGADALGHSELVSISYIDDENFDNPWMCV